MDPHQANFHPHLLLFNFPFRFNPTTAFFGITSERILSFCKHVSSLKAKFLPHLKALSCISASFPFVAPIRSPSLFCIKLFIDSFSLMLHPDAVLSLRYQLYLIGTPSPRGWSRHHRLPLVFPYPTRSPLTHFSRSSCKRAFRLPRSFLI